MELSKKSPYGSFDKNYSYVVVLNIGEFYEYYFACVDSSLHGIPIVHYKELNHESIVYGESKLEVINHVNKIESLYIANTIYEKSKNSIEDDKNILLSPVSGELAVSYDFRKDVYQIYSDIVKNIDTSVYNKEVLLSDGEVKYNNSVISSGYNKNINGLLRYVSFPNGENKEYYAGFFVNSSSFVAGTINKSDKYSSKNMVFDSKPTIVINEDSETVMDNDKKYLMWNLMALHPSNNNYTITECGAVILKVKNEEEVNLTLDTEKIMVGKSNNNCALGNVFGIRKDNVKSNDKFFARGYLKYKDQQGNEHIVYSKDTILGIVE